MNNLHRTSESEIAQAITQYLYDAGGEATMSQLRRALPNYIKLTKADMYPSPTRSGEQLWEQQVRNIVCHRNSTGNPVKEGELIYRPRMLKLVNGPQQDLFTN